ncbi:hypothetical protein J7M22_01810 [Candidatus Poribacteria bacterium]|nr:hypothetical protein [Candidatus Poribacteria bacterium]
MNMRGRFIWAKLIFIAMVIVPLNNLWVMDTGVVGHGVNFTRVSLFMNTIFVIFVLTFLNVPLKRFLPSLSVTKGEMLLLYAMLCVSSGIAGFDIIQRLYPLLGHAFYFATPENEWAELIHPYVPKWLVVTDRSVLDGYYKRGFFYRTLYREEYIRAWLVPSIAWSSVVIAVVLCMLCMNLLIRRQWTEHERLAYPLAQIPMEIIDGEINLFRSKLLWIGFAVSGGRDLINGLHYLFPIIPTILYGRFMLSQYFTTKPWNALGWVPIEFHPFAIGLAYFMPLDMAFSTWFFYWFWRFERVFGSVIGVKALRGFPFVWQQSIGVCLAILLFVLWMYRFQALRILKSLLGYPDKDRDELRTCRWAILGFLLSFGYLVGFCYFAGMKVWVASAFFLILLSFSLVVTRIRAEIGYPMHDLAFRPEDIMVTVVGTRPIGPENLTMFGYLHFLSYAHRSNPQPHQLEAFKIAERAKLKMDRLLILGIILAIVVGSLSACWAYLHTAYRFWGSTWDGWPNFNKIQRWLSYSRGPNVRSMIWMGFGLLMGFFLITMRRLFIWWPFHAAGYVVGGTWSLNLLWFSIFISWLIKWVILKFGGLRMHRKASDFFIGLVLGQFVMASFWGLLGSIMGRYMYRFI